MPLLTRKTWLLAKIESSEGSDPSPVGGSNAIQVTNVDITPIESDTIQADAMQGFLGNSTRATVLANKRVSVSFSTELSGSGSAGTPPAYGPLLKSCGLNEILSSETSATYTPLSTSFSSCTIYCFYDLTRHKITGARGTVTFNLVAGQIASADFQFIGVYNAPDSTDMSGTWTLANQAAGLEVNDTNITTATFHGVASQRIESFDLALNNEVVYKETVSSKQSLIVNRAPGGTAVIEALDTATTDYFAKAVAVSTGATDIILGASAGNIVRLKADQTDITGVSYGDTNGVRSLNVPYLALPTTAGNNEISLIYT